MPGLDPGISFQRREIAGSSPAMTDLAQEGMTMIVVTHEMGFARKVADLVVFMDQGEIVESHTPDDFFDNPKNERTVDFLKQILTH